MGEEITANEEKTSSSSAASTRSHTDKLPSNTKYRAQGQRFSCEITESSQKQSNEEHIYSNGVHDYNNPDVSSISNNKLKLDKTTFRDESGLSSDRYDEHSTSLVI